MGTARRAPTWGRTHRLATEKNIFIYFRVSHRLMMTDYLLLILAFPFVPLSICHKSTARCATGFGVKPFVPMCLCPFVPYFLF